MEACKSELQPSSSWSQKAIDQCRNLFAHENLVRICYDIKEQRQDYFFGDIYIQAFARSSKKICSIDIGNALVSIKQAIEIDFRKGIFFFNAHIFQAQSINQTIA